MGSSSTEVWNAWNVRYPESQIKIPGGGFPCGATVSGSTIVPAAVWVAAVAWVRSLAWKLSCSVRVGKKKKKVHGELVKQGARDLREMS